MVRSCGRLSTGAAARHAQVLASRRGRPGGGRAQPDQLRRVRGDTGTGRRPTAARGRPTSSGTGHWRWTAWSRWLPPAGGRRPAAGRQQERPGCRPGRPPSRRPATAGPRRPPATMSPQRAPSRECWATAHDSATPPAPQTSRRGRAHRRGLTAAGPPRPRPVRLGPLCQRRPGPPRGTPGPGTR